MKRQAHAEFKGVARAFVVLLEARAYTQILIALANGKD